MEKFTNKVGTKNSLSQAGSEVNAVQKLQKHPDLLGRVSFLRLYDTGDYTYQGDKNFSNLLGNLLKQRLEELNKSNSNEVRYIQINGEGHSYTIAVSKDCIFAMDSSLYSYENTFGKFLSEATRNIDSCPPLYCMSDIQTDEVSYRNYSTEIILGLDNRLNEYLKNNKTLKDFVEDKNEFHSIPNDNIQINNHTLVGVPNCIGYLEQSSISRLKNEISADGGGIIRKDNKTVFDTIEKHKKTIEYKGELREVNGFMDDKRNKPVEKVTGSNVQIINREEMKKKLNEHGIKVQIFDKNSNRLNQLSKDISYIKIDDAEILVEHNKIYYTDQKEQKKTNLRRDGSVIKKRI